MKIAVVGRGRVEVFDDLDAGSVLLERNHGRRKRLVVGQRGEAVVLV